MTRLAVGGDEVLVVSIPVEPHTTALPLTPSERDVCERIMLGQSNAQIAQELDITEGTAKQHAHAVYAAFGVSTRADLILAAQGKYRRTG